MGESSFPSSFSSSSSLFFWAWLLRSPGRPQVHHTFEDDLELLILLPPVPERWDSRLVPPFPAAGDWTQSLGMQGKHSTKGAASQFWSAPYRREWRHETLALSTAEKIVWGRRTLLWPGMCCYGRICNFKVLVSTPCTLGYTWLQQGVGVMASTCSMMTSGSWPLAQEFWAEPNIVKRSEAAHCCYLRGEPEGSLQGTWPRPWNCLQSVHLSYCFFDNLSKI